MDGHNTHAVARYLFVLIVDVVHFLSCIDNVLDQLSENAEALVDEREFLEVATAVN